MAVLVLALVLWVVLAAVTCAVVAAMCSSGKQEDRARRTDSYLAGLLRQP